MRGKLAETGLVADERDAPALCRLAQLAHHRARRVSGRKRLERLDRGLVGETLREQRRGLPGAHQRAGEDLVNLDVQPGQPFDGFLEPVMPVSVSGRLFVGPLLAALGGDRVANEIELAGFHSA